MTMDAQKMLSNGWNTMRDAGEAALDYPLVKQLPKVKDWVATGAGLAIAKRGTRVAVGAARRHPLLAIAGAVALAGVGLAVMASKRRAAAADGANDGASKPRRMKAKDMRGKSATKRASKSASRQSED
jgi:hypothetical protein